MRDEVLKQARKEIEEENFRLAVERQKTMLRWPWYKKIFPYRIKLTVVDLRRGNL